MGLDVLFIVAGSAAIVAVGGVLIAIGRYFPTGWLGPLWCFLLLTTFGLAIFEGNTKHTFLLGVFIVAFFEIMITGAVIIARR
jgi:hypothetical protein